jgi:hypothetical protein
VEVTVNLGVFSTPDPLKVAVVRAFAAAAAAGEELAAAGLVAELVVGALPELAAGLPLPWEEMALIAMIATTKPPMPARTSAPDASSGAVRAAAAVSVTGTG